MDGMDDDAFADTISQHMRVSARSRLPTDHRRRARLRPRRRVRRR
jgi:hypothetical protein